MCFHLFWGKLAFSFNIREMKIARMAKKMGTLYKATLLNVFEHKTWQLLKYQLIQYNDTFFELSTKTATTYTIFCSENIIWSTYLCSATSSLLALEDCSSCEQPIWHSISFPLCMFPCLYSFFFLINSLFIGLMKKVVVRWSFIAIKNF